MDVRVYINRKWVDYLEVSRGMQRRELEALIWSRAVVNSGLNGRSVERVAFVQKRYHLNVCLFTE